MKTSKSEWLRQNRKRFCVYALLLIVFVLAAWTRLRGVAAFNALYDAIGPYWAAIRLDGRAHASPYGVLLVAPYLAAVHFTSSLWDAVQVVSLLHSFVAVVTSLACLQIWPKRLGLAFLLGVLVALDPGLVDTAISGAKAYYGGLFIGLMVLSRGPWVWVCWAFAVANHPMALAAFPLVLVPGCLARKNLWGVGLSLTAIALQASGWGDPGVGNGPDFGVVQGAAGSFLHKGGWIAGLILVGPFVGSLNTRTRGIAFRVSVAFGVLFIIGWHLGYLRDHHLRLFTVPALMGWGAIPGKLVFLLGAALRIPAHPVFPAGMVEREATVGLAHRVGDLLEKEKPPFIVDGAWLSGGPSVEASTAMLDLYLRGWDEKQLNTSGDVVVIVSAERKDISNVEEVGRTILKGGRYRVFRASPDLVHRWSLSLCEQDPKLGGAWDAVSVFTSDANVKPLRQWWACD